MDQRRHLARALAAVLLSGPWTRRELEARARDALGSRSAKRATRIVQDLLERHTAPYAPARHQLERLIVASRSFAGLGKTAIERLDSLNPTPEPRFAPVPALRDAKAPAIATTGDLANWLHIRLAHLDWFADERRTLRREPNLALQHYTCAWVPKSDGSHRLIEAPKPRLRDLQRRILHEILDHLPPHDAAYGFVKGRSCASAAAKHAGEDVLVTVDLENFFLNTKLARVHAIFRCLGYPYAVARVLTRLCGTITPRTILDAQSLDFLTRQRFATPHLPQGAPTSPALANLVALRLDHRLTGLARRFEARYTRYADDLTFSGDKTFRDQVPAFLRAVSEVVADEGFSLNAPKTRIMPRATRQTVTGIVVNDHINVARPAYDALKATLTNCLRHGPASQNRNAHSHFRDHLDGRIAWIESLNLRRGEKLRRIFDAISW